MPLINWLKHSLLKSGKKFYEVLVGKINEPKLKNFPLVDLYVLVACPEQSLVEFKMFNMTVVSPHEALMALEPEVFPWESKVVTHFEFLLNRKQNEEQKLELIYSH
jgi:diphthamide biosynthesis protein 2